jgi:osmoprotectant transport system ATP-binding protein
LIAVHNVSKRFGSTTAVADISFDIKEGERFILLGTSGCGKTTTLRMLNSLIKADSGSIKINGQNINSQHPEILRRSIGYVLQHNSLFPHYTVAENIAVVPNLLKWDKQKIATRTRELLQKLHLEETYLSNYPHQLSGGQQQRVNIARALAANPPILLMDEPFGALDNITRIKVRGEFEGLDELGKTTIVMVTHDIQEAFEMGTTICLMDKGEIVQCGTPADLLFRPANDFVTKFFADGWLQYALRVVKLDDIWDLLPSDNSPSNNSTSISSTASIWHALEKLNDTESLIIEKGGTQKAATRETLFTAFNHYKTR